MKRLLILLAVIGLTAGKANAYIDHRGHNVDSLERVVAHWTEDRWAEASEKQSEEIIYAYWSLMLGYRNINAERSMFFARKCYKLATRWNWLVKMADGLNGIALIHYGRGQYDSSLFYFNQALEMTERMLRGETSFTMDKPYPEMDIDDTRSLLYGAIGNTYNLMDSIPKAMEYYKKAGEIFEKYGWKESCSLLHYNMGETWMESYDYDKALLEYKEALRFGQEAGDSLCVANASMGLGRWYLEKGRPRKAMRYRRKADEYYSVHPDQEFRDLIENSGYTAQVLKAQKRQITWIAIGLAVLVAGLATFLVLLRRRRKAAASPAPAAVKLTARELEILRFIADGKTNTQIAEALFLSPETTKWYRKQLFAKFDAENAADLVRKAMEQKVL